MKIARALSFQRRRPKSRSNEDGVKTSRSKGSDKARRSFELNGTYSSKHLRLREERALAEAARKSADASEKKAGSKKR